MVICFLFWVVLADFLRPWILSELIVFFGPFCVQYTSLSKKKKKKLGFVVLMVK